MNFVTNSRPSSFPMPLACETRVPFPSASEFFGKIAPLAVPDASCA